MIIKRITEQQTSWDELKEAAQRGALDTVVKSGDSIAITLKTGEHIYLDVTFDENGNCFFVFHDCMQKRRQMNKYATNKGGWAASDLRKVANEEIFNSLPDELQEIIVPTKIVQIIDGKRIECYDKLFCLSYTQIAGKDWPEINEREPEDTQLDIFKTDRSRVKEIDGEAVSWWERSPSINGSNNFYNVSTSGNPNNLSNAYNTYGVSLGFRIDQ